MGNIIYPNSGAERIGLVRYNRDGLEMEIIEYNMAIDIVVEFNSGYKKRTQWSNFINGNIKDKLSKTVFNVGYFGDGIFTTTKTKSEVRRYNAWMHMLERCYDEKYSKRCPTYIGCTVCDEWHNFQNFAKWYNENYYEIEGEIMCLDKDVLVKGNKVYSPSKCVFVPQAINSLFTKRNADRGEYPIGVAKSGDKYTVRLSNDRYYGRYNCPNEAFYKGSKPAIEKHILDVANKYKEHIPSHLYIAMCSYKIEIGD